METRYAFFNVDCHERAKDGPGFIYRPRVKPISEKVDRFHAFAKEHDVRIVFTTCCDGLMIKPEESNDILYVPVEEKDQTWIDGVVTSRVIYMHKLAWGTPKEDIKHVAWDMFLHNKNAAKLIKALDIPRWIVFGNGMDLCVSSAAKGILAAGYSVTLIEDVMISSANGTPESKEKTIDDLCKMGATRLTYDQFFNEMG